VIPVSNNFGQSGAQSMAFGTPAAKLELLRPCKGSKKPATGTTPPPFPSTHCLHVQVLEEAKGRLRSEILSRLDVAKKQKDHTGVLRFTRLYAPLGLQVSSVGSCGHLHCRAALNPYAKSWTGSSSSV
jgi:hypothetical protein